VTPLSLRSCCSTEIDKAKRQVKSILNKLTRERFDKLYGQLLDCFPKEDDPAFEQIIAVVAQEVFGKATVQHAFIEMYADVCAKLSEDLKSQGVQKHFRHALLDQCQKSFNRHLDPPPVRGDLGCEEQYEERVRYKTRMLGNVRLIGQLLRRRMLATRIIFHCTEELLSIASPEAVETLCAFLETVGSTFDTPRWQGHARLEGIFMRMEVFLEDPQQCQRNRFLVRDLLDKRKNSWRTRASTH
jgi:translation initiation factor 4G